MGEKSWGQIIRCPDLFSWQDYYNAYISELITKVTFDDKFANNCLVILVGDPRSLHPLYIEAAHRWSIILLATCPFAAQYDQRASQAS
jgi:hypothetical protein